MSKSKPIPLTTKAVAITRDSNQDFLSDAVEITIVNGVVTEVKCLTRGADVPAQSIGKANSALWDHFRTENTFAAQQFREKQ